MIVAVYPGSFDPITVGHIDVIKRGSILFSKLIVAIYERDSKPLLFSTEERVAMAKEALVNLPNVSVRSYGGLTVDFIHKVKGRVMIRGLRMTSDFEHEFEMAAMNKYLASDIELVCLMTSCQYQFISSSLIKEIAKSGGCLEGMVPDHVAVALREKFFTQPSKTLAEKTRSIDKRHSRA